MGQVLVAPDQGQMERHGARLDETSNHLDAPSTDVDVKRPEDAETNSWQRWSKANRQQDRQEYLQRMRADPGIEARQRCSRGVDQRPFHTRFT